MFKKAYLDNGMPVVMEQIRNVRSVALGIWIKVGSRDEPADKNGISHFLEHMFFKGTKKRTAKDIAVDADSFGGDLNAFTSRENTTFYIKVLDEYLDNGVELLADIFLHSTFPEDAIEKEKEIINEEIKMIEDTPDDYVHDLFSQTTWGDQGIGQPVIGKKDTIKYFKRDDLIKHIKHYYGTKDTVIACAGNFYADELLKALNNRFGSLRRGSEPERRERPVFKSKTDVYTKDLSEVHFCVGIEGISQASKDRYALFLANTILGAGVSSRLFQEVREKRGLAYSIYSYVSSYFDTGMWAVYAGVGRNKLIQVIELILKEIRSLPLTLTDIELERAKAQLKSNLILGLESTSNRMQNLARQEIYYGKYYSTAAIMKEIDSVGLKDIKGLSERLIKKNTLALTVLGPVSENELAGILN